MLDDNVDETIKELAKEGAEKKKMVIDKVLKMQEEGKTREEICKELKYGSTRALSNFMKRNGYKSENKIYIKDDVIIESDNNQNSIRFNDNTKVDIIEDKSEDNQRNIRNIKSDYTPIISRDNNSVKVREISDKSMNDILEIIKRKDDILKMLEWFDGVEEPVKVSNELKIEINASTDKKDRKSIFFNPELWNRFENFCKKNKQFKKHDIINQALYELLERVDNGE